MWWPSFVAVLQDLWQFCTSGQKTAVPMTSEQPLLQNHSQTYLPVSQPTIPIRLDASQQYAEQHPDTKTIRASLAAYDPHMVAVGPLTKREWLLGAISAKSAAAPLLALQMTPIGSWYKTLQSVTYTNSTVTPKTSALMEWVVNQSTSQAAIVHEVSPEETVTIGYMSHPGAYSEQVLLKEQWVELRPTFTTST